MLIEILHPITVDGIEVCKSFRLNLLNDQRKFRCKIQFPDNPNQQTLVDINAYEYSLPRIEGLGFATSIRGIENVTGLTFNATISFKFNKHMWRISGKIGDRPFESECTELIMILTQIRSIVFPTTVGQPIQLALPININQQGGTIK